MIVFSSSINTATFAPVELHSLCFVDSSLQISQHSVITCSCHVHVLQCQDANGSRDIGRWVHRYSGTLSTASNLHVYLLTQQIIKLGVVTALRKFISGT